MSKETRADKKNKLYSLIQGSFSIQLDNACSDTSNYMVFWNETTSFIKIITIFCYWSVILRLTFEWQSFALVKKSKAFTWADFINMFEMNKTNDNGNIFGVEVKMENNN